MSHIGLVMVRMIGLLPLPLVRACGVCLGHLLHTFAARRRHVVDVNLQACFPELSAQTLRALARAVFVRFAQAWLDRGWLWHCRRDVLARRVSVSGQLDRLENSGPTLLFVPHFVGLDAGWTALAAVLERPLVTLYTRQANPVFDHWIVQGRRRWGRVKLLRREDGPKPLVAALRTGELLYLLPDMNFGERESIFVPFFGVQAATVTSLSRLAKLSRAQVIPVIVRMTDRGYDVEVGEPWLGFPSQDAIADTAEMNRRLESIVRTMPDQYYWVHRRFKTRPPGEPQLY